MSDALIDAAKTDIGLRLDKLKTDIKAAAQPSNVYDDYPATYDIKADNTLSPNGKWRLIYTGHNPQNTNEKGQSGVRAALVPDNSPRVYYAYPYSTTNTGTATNATLTLSEQEFTNFDLTFYVRTKRSLKSTPKSWETAWLLFRFNTAGFPTTDPRAHFHHYYFLIHRTGKVEFGRKDNTTQMEEQTFLSTSAVVTYADNKFYKIRIKAVGNHFTIWIDGIQKIDLTDDGTVGTRVQQNVGPIAVQPPSTFMSSGKFGPYAEDAEGEWSPFMVAPL